MAVTGTDALGSGRALSMDTLVRLSRAAHAPDTPRPVTCTPPPP